jgi:hypothetical protein
LALLVWSFGAYGLVVRRASEKPGREPLAFVQIALSAVAINAAPHQPSRSTSTAPVDIGCTLRW